MVNVFRASAATFEETFIYRQAKRRELVEEVERVSPSVPPAGFSWISPTWADPRDTPTGDFVQSAENPFLHVSVS